MADVIFNDITPHLGLPLPHPSNDLEVDAPRLRTALGAIDAKFAALDALLASDDVDLDQLQELVSAIKANANDVVALLASKAGRDELAAVVADKASRTELAAVAAAAFPPPAIRITGYTELLPNKRYHLDSSGGAFSVLLPAGPDACWVWLRDIAGACGANPVTVLRNGNTMSGQADDTLIDAAHDDVFLSLDANNWTD